ncbi:hypothetical protein QGN32_20545 [Mycolicibacterium sp. ND9-15]|uniref:hypothetical protein n=1 Tax=Mycolicibacterium sp. ND9-15 TaxID=3042320 RepID=UPI002DDA2354|nr:hypothetical protein [Mycolicibacterium sp. ND9-15]WSE55757.1 hypothetical protein QGN32_20545 [Mycolicibacterium sp. ND9-15]
MNRRQRRAKARDPRSARRIIELQHRVDTTGLPGVIHGLTDACADCTAEGAIILLPGGDAIGHVYHDDHCPAAAGIVQWRPAP